ncbi:MAG: translocation/assembly module TamB domain-containing protein, partial [Candidatus Omnitrophota bacterium]
ETLVYQDIEFHGLKWLPKGNSLKIQRLEISLSSFSLEGLNIKIQNGRIQFSGSETILFYGEFRNGTLNVSAYTSSISIRDTLDLFAETAALKKISGSLSNVDINIKGSFLDPEIQGSFLVKKLSRDMFTMADCPGKLNLKLADIKDALKINGEILLESGALSGPKTALIRIKESRILFTGDPNIPTLHLRGTSAVEDVTISILLKGTFDEPDLKLTSQPAMDQDRLLLMLATNKTWKSVETALHKQELSADIAKDFLDYFVFSGSGDKIAQKYGIRDILVKYNGTMTKVGATKDITANTAVSYSVAQQQEKEKNPSLSHKVGTEYKINEAISITGEKEIKQNSEAEQTRDEQKTDDKVMLKFKKEF